MLMKGNKINQKKRSFGESLKGRNVKQMSRGERAVEVVVAVVLL